MENKLSIIKDKFKELPNNIEAEQAVIGSILVPNEIFDEINLIIASNNFYDPMHEIIVLISSKISLLTKIEPITACSASILFGNSLNWSFTTLKLFSINKKLQEIFLIKIVNYSWGKECIIIE